MTRTTFCPCEGTFSDHDAAGVSQAACAYLQPGRNLTPAEVRTG